MVKSVSEPRWLLFLPQLPAKPDYARVKLWRRLQPLGAVGLRGGVYVLPNTEDSREDLEWVGKEVEGDGGTAVVCEAVFLEGVSDDELERTFRERSASAYQDIAARARAALGDPAGTATAVRRLRRQLEAEKKRDLFGASHRAEAERAVRELDNPSGAARKTEVTESVRRPSGAVWVTRAGVFVDRIASAWLIRRFIDRKATFKFVSGHRYAPRPNEIRFDMFQAEYTHRGDQCTFETLLHNFGLTSPALDAIGEIVHDLDLKDDKYQRPESEGIAQVLRGLALAEPDDAKRLKAGAMLFDNLFAQLSAEGP